MQLLNVHFRVKKIPASKNISIKKNLEKGFVFNRMAAFEKRADAVLRIDHYYRTAL